METPKKTPSGTWVVIALLVAGVIAAIAGRLVRPALKSTASQPATAPAR